MPVYQSFENLPCNVSWSFDQHVSGGSFSISGLLREIVGSAIERRVSISGSINNSGTGNVCRLPIPLVTGMSTSVHIFFALAVPTAREVREIFYFAMSW